MQPAYHIKQEFHTFHWVRHWVIDFVYFYESNESSSSQHNHSIHVAVEEHIHTVDSACTKKLCLKLLVTPIEVAK